MTLTMAWVRKSGGYEEVVMASDSRLSGGAESWDTAPKLFALPRGDCAIGFCGPTAGAYPYIMQLQQALSLHRASMNRSLSFGRSEEHILNILNNMASIVKMEVKGEQASIETARFLVAGYCWRANDFKLWQFRYGKNAKKFVPEKDSVIYSKKGPQKIIVIGDPNIKNEERKIKRKKGEPDPALADDVQRYALEKIARKIKDKDGDLDMEPLEVLVEMLKANVSRHVGGAAQVMKVYKYASVMGFATECTWVPGSVKVFISGRPLMDYERYEIPILNVETMEIRHLSKERRGSEAAMEPE